MCEIYCASNTDSLSPQVYLKAPMILNGVCVIWRGWIDLTRLDGMGYLEYDEERAQVTQDTHRSR